jgi:hypothetical protein
MAGEVDRVEVRARWQAAEDDLPRDVLGHVLGEGGGRAVLAEQPGEHSRCFQRCGGHAALMSSRSTVTIRSAACG